MSKASEMNADDVLLIAKNDAEHVYRDLTPYHVTLALESDGWHVDYARKDPNVNGGSPHYVIAATTGAVLAKRYDQ